MERQYRGRQASGRARWISSGMGGCCEAGLVRGVDWGSQKHQARVLDVAGQVLGEREFEHGGTGLSQMADWLLSFTRCVTPGRAPDVDG